MPNETTVKLKGENKQLQDKLQESERAVSDFKSVFLTQMVAVAAGTAAATGGISLLVGAFTRLLGIGPDMVAAFSAQEDAEKALESQLKRTGQTVGYTAEQLKMMAARLQVATGAGDEAIIMAQTITAKFDNIRGDRFREVTELAIDMARVLKTDLSGATEKLAKSIQAPIDGLGELKEAGVLFTAQQEDMVKKLMQAGDVLGAQQILIDEVSKTFGGAAKDSLKTFAGTVEALMGRVGDLKEVGGKIIVEFLKPMLPLIDDAISFLENASGAVTEFAISIKDKLVEQGPAIKKFFEGFLQAGVYAFSALQTAWSNSGDFLSAGIEGVKKALTSAFAWIVDNLQDLFTNTIPNLLVKLLKAFYALFDDIAKYAVKTMNATLREMQGWTKDIVSVLGVVGQAGTFGAKQLAGAGQGAADLIMGRRTTDSSRLEQLAAEGTKAAQQSGKQQETALERIGNTFDDNLKKNQDALKSFLDMFNRANPPDEGAPTTSDAAFRVFGVEAEKEKEAAKDKAKAEGKKEAEQSRQGQFEGLEATWQRITQAVAGPEDRRHKEQLEALERIAEAIEDTGPAKRGGADAMPKVSANAIQEFENMLFGEALAQTANEANQANLLPQNELAKLIGEASGRMNAETPNLLKELIREMQTNTAVNRDVAENVKSVGTLG